MPKDRNGKISKDHLRLVLDVVAPSAGLPPIGAVEQVVLHLLHSLIQIYVIGSRSQVYAYAGDAHIISHAY